MIEIIFHKLPYFASIAMMCIGLYMAVAKSNLISRLIGLGFMQTGVLVLFIAIGKVNGGIPPVLGNESQEIYSNPVPHVLMLTAIVVGAALLAIGIVIIKQVHKYYNSIDEIEVQKIINGNKE